LTPTRGSLQVSQLPGSLLVPSLLSLSGLGFQNSLLELSRQICNACL
jgi:hypothetical protein